MMGEEKKKKKEIVNNDNPQSMSGVEEQYRVKQYPEGHKGPYIVNIRAINEPLETKKIQKYVFEKFYHVERIEHVNEHKLRVIFKQRESTNTNVEKCGESSKALKSAREEANELPNANEWNKKFRVYISEKNVEVKGVIAWPVNEDISDFVKYGEGKFFDLRLKPVKVLEVVRLKRKVIENNEEKLENTATVIVSFEGVVLPNKLNINGLLIPVREFRNKQMFCHNCKRYNHTEKMCNNKKVEIPVDAGFKCIQCKSNEHESGDMKCPKRKQIEKKAIKSEKQVRKLTVAEMLRELDPSGTMPNESISSNSFPLLPGLSRKRQAEIKQAEREKYSDVLKSPVKKKKTTDLNAPSRKQPPGFKNPNINSDNNELAETIVEFLKSFLGEMEIPSFAKSLIEKFLFPFVHKFINKITNSVMQKMNDNELQWQHNSTQ